MIARQRKAAVRVATDVIAQLKAKLIEPEHLYVRIPGLWDETEGESLKKVLAARAKEKEPCEVCALGACFIANVAKTNKVEVQSWGYTRDDLTNNLKKIFSHAQMNLIESAYEQIESVPIGTDHPGVEAMENAVSFGLRYDDDAKRLRAIMRNIIRNNGEFIPPKARKTVTA